MAIINDKSSNKSISNSNKNVKNSFTVDTEETERINNSAIEHFRRTKLKIKEADLYKQTAPQLSVDTEHKSTSIRSISNLLDYVNNYYPDILSKDVLKHYGYKSRPKGKLGESALYSKEVDEFDEQDYNYPKLGNKEYRHLYSEIITNFPNVRNEVNCIRLTSTDSTYVYILDDEYNLIVCDKRPITNIRERGNNDESNGFTKRFDTRLKSLRNKGRSDKSHNISFDDRKTTERNVRLSDREIQSKRNSNGAGYYENGNNADLREEKS